MKAQTPTQKLQAITKKAQKKKAYVPSKSLQIKRGDAVRARIVKYVEQNPDCKIVVSTSGGKDSAALLNWAVKLWGADRIVAAHAEIDLDWHETLAVTQAQCTHLGVELHVVKRDDGASILDLLMRGQTQRKTGQWVQKKFAGPGTQWCTAQAKIVPLDKLCKSLGDNVLVLIGERADESDNRARKHVWKKETFKRLGKVMVKASPLYDKTVDEVWQMHDELGTPRHPIYALGHTRASCAICIFSRPNEIALAANHAPDIVARYLVAEKNIAHTFKPKSTIAQILIEQGIDPEAIIAAHINDPKVAKYNVGESTEATAKLFA